MGAPVWVLNILCPTIGVVLANLMWLSPMKAVLTVRKTRDIGQMNPIPFNFIIWNCTGWVIYGLVIKDLFIFWANFTGLLFGLFYVSNCLSLLASQTRPGEALNNTYRVVELLLITAFGFWCTVTMIAVFAWHDRSSDDQDWLRKLVIGKSVLVFNVLYFAAPLSTLFKIIKLHDSSSILPPLVALNLATAMMWLAYGVAISDLNLLVPNGLGVLLACSQAVILVVYRKTPAGSEHAESVIVEESSMKYGGLSDMGAVYDYKAVDHSATSPLFGKK